MTRWIVAAAFLLPLLKPAAGTAQGRWNEINEKGIVSRDTFSREGFTLVFINKSADFNAATGKRMVDAFYTVYPKQAKLYNKHTLRKVVFIIDPEYKGVAATAGGIVRISPEWMQANPGDIDVVTHEVMHIAQAYPDGAGPGWITEGIADYVRYSMGVDNAGSNWALPDYSAGQHYQDAYRVTARFLAWIEKHKKAGLVQKLDAAMRSKTYSAQFWSKQTGLTVDELWKEYTANPAL